MYGIQDSHGPGKMGKVWGFENGIPGPGKVLEFDKCCQTPEKVREKEKGTFQKNWSKLINSIPLNRRRPFAFVHSRVPFISTSLIGQTVCGWLVHGSLHRKQGDGAYLVYGYLSIRRPKGELPQVFSLTLEWEVMLGSELYWKRVSVLL